MIKIKKLTLESDFGVLKKQSIEFSADEQKPLTVIIGQNDGGKTTLVNAIKMGLDIEPAVVPYGIIGAKPVLETTSDSSFVSKENEFLFFPDMERWNHYIKQTPDRLKQFSNQSVADKMNEFKDKSFGAYKHHYSKFIFDETGNLHLVHTDGLDEIGTLAAAESFFVNLIWVLAVRHFVAPNSFLVLDGGTGRLSSDKIESLISLLFSLGDSSQIIWLVTDHEWSESSETLPTLRESILKEQVLGKEYEIVDGYVVPFGV